jgi:membrane protein implicated in regulation of membrane protease activity
VAGWLREHGLSVVLVSVFAGCMAAQVLAGRLQHNDERRQHGEPPVSVREYLASSHFWEATAENWESEFLQMAAYVLLTAGLYQRGSSESKNPDKREAVDRDPRNARGKARAEAPGPVRRGGWVLKLYEHSLSLTFVALFMTSFWLHAAGGTRAHNAEELLHGGASVTVLQYMATPQFWFESFQNWQSEFLALVAMVILSIWLRQRGSPESKPVDAPHSATGSSS